jgi:hypothetical protein
MYLYFKYGRAKRPGQAMNHEHAHHEHMHHGKQEEEAIESRPDSTVHDGHSEHAHRDGSANQHVETDHSQIDHSKMDHSQMDHPVDHPKHHTHIMPPNIPSWATILISVSHCGAGCVLGDLVGEWLVFGTGFTIHNSDTWPCLLIDYAFALLFGIFFQYFSIAPMSGEYGPRTLVRAAKADILSLTSFEIGLFGWMVAYQVGIWDYRLVMNTWVYWWMMVSLSYSNPISNRFTASGHVVGVCNRGARELVVDN